MAQSLGLSLDKVTIGTTPQHARILDKCCYDTKTDWAWARIAPLHHRDGPSCKITDGVFHVTLADPGWAISGASSRV